MSTITPDLPRPEKRGHDSSTREPDRDRARPLPARTGAHVRAPQMPCPRVPDSGAHGAPSRQAKSHGARISLERQRDSSRPPRGWRCRDARRGGVQSTTMEAHADPIVIRIDEAPVPSVLASATIESSRPLPRLSFHEPPGAAHDPLEEPHQLARRPPRREPERVLAEPPGSPDPEVRRVDHGMRRRPWAKGSLLCSRMLGAGTSPAMAQAVTAPLRSVRPRPGTSRGDATCHLGQHRAARS